MRNMTLLSAAAEILKLCGGEPGGTMKLLSGFVNSYGNHSSKESGEESDSHRGSTNL